MVLKEMKINHAQVLFRGDYDADELIDVVLGNRVYTRALYCYNKCDLVRAIRRDSATFHTSPLASFPRAHNMNATRLSLLFCRLS